MRPRLQNARDLLAVILSRKGPMTVPELAAALDVSGPTVLRMLREVPGHVVVAGQARRRRYAWQRALPDGRSGLSLYQVDPQGRVHEAGALTLVAPQGTHWMLPAPLGWPVPAESADGWWDGLPMPLQDMRPQGFMGRHFARRHHRQLGLQADPSVWSDEEVLRALASPWGGDVGGDLIIGDQALQAWQLARRQGSATLSSKDLGAHYVALAEAAIATGPTGSSAAGEFPKFTACRALAGAATPHVIVKFSGADASAAVRRWSDLLVCECLALQAMAQAWPDVAVAATRIVQHGGRTFLESERFDRHGEAGRSPLVSLGTVNACLVGAATNDWPELARRLQALRLLDASQVEQIARIWWFGHLIGNTDMHTGNLSFVPQGGALGLAPAYDMLPMMYAPMAGGEVPARAFEPAWPKPAERAVWVQACQAALSFWDAVLRDARIGNAFKRTVAQAHAEALRRTAALV